MKTYRVAVVAGDGIGPEVIAAALEVMEGAQQRVGGFHLEFVDAPAGACTFRECGRDLPESSLEACRQADAILLGACGWPGVRHVDGTELTPQITLRKELDLYAGLRPARRLRGIRPTLANDPPIDLVIVRESTEGLFASLGGGIMLRDEMATDTQVITRRGTERVVRAAFELARERGREVPRVTCVDKANVFRSFAFFRKVFAEVASEYPDIQADYLYVDAAAMEMVRRPGQFDVMVMENLLGDILSDLGAGLVGGLGMAPSADLGDRHAVFQPCHGTAPDIAGKGLANPVAAILSAAMLLAHLGRKFDDPAPREAANRIEAAVAAALQSSESHTPDLGGKATTRGVSGWILGQLS